MKIRSSSVPKAGGKNPRAADKQVKTMTASHLSEEKINDVLTRVRVLAWKGQHTQAIELATQELSRSEWHSDLLI